MIDRVHGRAAFRRFQREGTRVRSGSIWCTMVPDRSVTSPQVAFAIGRPVGNAVVRNRVRRRMRALLRERTLPPGLYLVGATPATADITFQQLSDTVDDLLRRLDQRLASRVDTASGAM